MQCGGPCGQIRAGSEPVELPITENEPFERRRVQGPFLECRDTVDADGTLSLRGQVQRVILGMRLRPRRISPGDETPRLEPPQGQQ